MAQIIWTEPALENLNDIAEYIAVNNPSQLVKHIFNKLHRLEQFSESGRIPEEISTLNYREVIIKPCRVFYKIDNDSVYILHVLRQERDLRKFLLSAENE